jgi:processive 1,2-diacylglycerol beta-glucosyltransferase
VPEIVAESPPPTGPQRPARPPRILILTTDIGEGHDLPARQLAEGLEKESPGAQVAIADGLAAMGRILNKVIKDQSRVIFKMPTWVWNFEHYLAIHWPPTRWLGKTLNYLLGSRGLTRLIRSHDPDVVVSTYPGTTMVLGMLRLRGLLQVPTVAAITDLAELRYWAMPGVDMHLVTHDESIPEVLGLAPDTDVRWVRGLTSPGFTELADPADGRREFGLPEGVPVVVVSGGGWGVGDLEGAVREALALPGSHVVILCGRNEELQARMEAAFGDEQRVHVSGFTNKMSELFAAADVLVHSTAGLTVLEAHIRGCRVISYGWGVAHIRANNRAFVQHRIAYVAKTRPQLAAALRQAVAERGEPVHETYAALPSAASAVLDAVPARRAV